MVEQVPWLQLKPLKKKIVVLATETTIQSYAYQRLIQHYLPESHILARACSLLVALAEEGMIDNEITRVALLHYLHDIKDEDTILLGCTHFPVFTDLLSQLFPNIAIVDSAATTADALEQILKEKNLKNNSNQQGNTQYLVTDSVQRFQKVGEVFLKAPLNSEDLELIDGIHSLNK